MWLADKMAGSIDFPALQGSKQQVAVAENIRTRILMDLLEEIFKRYSEKTSDTDSDFLNVLELIRGQTIPESVVFWELVRQDWAIWWIDNRFAEAADFLIN
jgi:hypothetical protein